MIIYTSLLLLKARIDHDDVDEALRRRLESVFITSRMNLQSRKMRMQNDIEKLLSDKFSETINDSTALRLLKAMIQLLSLLFTRESDMRQRLINIKKKLERIESNIFKTKTNIEIYAIAIKIESLTNVDVTTTTRRDLNVSTIQQKIFTKIKKKRRWW